MLGESSGDRYREGSDLFGRPMVNPKSAIANCR